MPAHGAVSHRDDPVDDVWDSASNSVLQTPEPIPNVDLVAFEVRHQLHGVVFHATFMDLRPKTTERALEVHLMAHPADGGEPHPFTYHAFSRRGETRYSHTLYDLPDYGVVACDGLRRKVDYEAETLWMKVPRSCIGTPETVQFAASAMRPYGGNGSAAYDDARSTAMAKGWAYTDYSEHIPSSPRIP
jgi:hypothetical protein